MSATPAAECSISQVAAPSITAMAILGYNSGSSGTTTVDGTGSKWRMEVGVMSATPAAECSISQVAAPSITAMAISVYNSGLIRHDDGGWHRLEVANSAYLIVGYSGSGGLNITHGWNR